MNEKLVTIPAIIAATIFFCAAYYAITVVGDTLTSMIRLVIWIGGSTISAGLVIGGVYLLSRMLVNLTAGGLVALEQIKQEREKTAEQRAKRRLAEKEADIHIVTAGDAVFVREMNHAATWLPLHLNPIHRINGLPAPPAPVEVATWQLWNQRDAAHPLKSLPDALPAPIHQLPQRISLLDLLPADGASLQNIVLGVAIDPLTGEPETISAPLEKLVHVAVGGETDSGKSNFGRALAYQTLTAMEDVKVVLVDIGRTTFKPFANNGRLLYPLVDTETDCLATLNELLSETRRRSQMFDTYPTVEKLSHFNRLSSIPLPYIVAFFDEVTDLFENKDIQTTARRLIRVSRKFGIYLVALGQSWKHSDLDTSIRRQFRTAIHFAAKDAGSSRTLLNAPDAVNITQQGRAIAALPFSLSSDLMEIQTPYLDLTTVFMTLDTQKQPGQSIEPIPVLEPTLEESHILALANLDTSISAIATEVYGSKGGPQNAKVKSVLEKFGRV